MPKQRATNPKPAPALRQRKAFANEVTRGGTRTGQRQSVPAEKEVDVRAAERMALAVVDGLMAQIAVVDARGRILFVNQRWRDFAAAKGGALVSVCEGVNYLKVCASAARSGCPEASAVATGIRQVLAGRRDCFSTEYPCHAPSEQQWFTVKVTPFPGGGPARALIAHEDTTDRVQAEEALRRSEERFRGIFKHAPTGIAISEIGGSFVQCNPAYCRITGYSEAELRAMSFSSLIHPEDRARNMEVARRLMDETIPSFAIENRYVRKSGDPIHVHKFVSLLRDRRGRATHMLALVKDITERKQAEGALRASEERYRQLIHSLPVALYTVDAKGRIRLFNAAAAKLWGREPKMGVERLGAARRLLTPEGQPIPRSRWPIAVALRQGEPMRDVEAIIETREGRRSHVLIFSDPIHDGAGAIAGAVNVVVDITALKVAENALRTSQRNARKLSRVVEQSPTSVLITDPSGSIEYVNPKFTEVTGYSLAEVMGKNPRLLKSGANPAGLYREMWETITAGRVWRGAICNRRKNGELFWEFAVIAPIEDEHGAVSHYVAIKEDITERRQAAAELQESEERMRAILNTVRDAIVTIDRRGTITSVNPATARMFGYSEAEMVGQNVSLLMPSPYREEHDGYLENYHRTGEARIIGIGRDVQARRKDGGIFPIELAVSEVEQMQIFTGVIRDLTVRKRLEAEVLRIADEERQRVAADLHDGVCQELVGVQFIASALRQDLEKAEHPLAHQAARIEEAIRGTADRTRQVARGMVPVIADGSGLMYALRRLAEMTRLRGIRCVFQCPLAVAIENALTASELYRIAQEAVHNALRHSGASRITLHLSEADGEACLAVMDNGRGLPRDVSGAAGMGLRVMRYRAGVIGGHFQIEPRKPKGTVVVCRVSNRCQ